MGKSIYTFSQFQQAELALALAVELPADPWETEFNHSIGSPLISSSNFNSRLPSSTTLPAHGSGLEPAPDSNSPPQGSELYSNQTARPMQDWPPNLCIREDSQAGLGICKRQASAPTHMRDPSRVPPRAADSPPAAPMKAAARSSRGARDRQAEAPESKERSGLPRPRGKPCKARGFLKPNSDKDFRRMESYCHMMSAKVPSPSLRES